MWRRSLLQLPTRQPLVARSQCRWLSSTMLTAEEKELLNGPREAMDYDVVLVHTFACRVMVAS